MSKDRQPGQYRGIRRAFPYVVIPFLAACSCCACLGSQADDVNLTIIPNSGQANAGITFSTSENRTTDLDLHVDGRDHNINVYGSVFDYDTYRGHSINGWLNLPPGPTDSGIEINETHIVD